MGRHTELRDTPEMINMCLRCARVECPGDCDAMQAMRRGEIVRPPRPPRPNTLTALAARHGQTYDIVKKRMKRGETMEQALSRPKEQIPRHAARGLLMTVTEWATVLSVSREMILYRLRNGWNMERIAAYYAENAAGCTGRVGRRPKYKGG